MVQEKRRHERVPVELPVTVRLSDGQEVPGLARDVSVGGMFIECAHRGAFGESVEVHVSSEEHAGLVLPGVIRWKRELGIGVQFGLLGARQTHALVDLMQRR